jgi:glycosyltransferase involved in cell wall biosynthesis
MKIGVMLRAIDEKQGIGVYTQNLMDHLLPLDQKNEYVLFYRNPQFLGRYAHYDHVREKLVTAPNKLIWDQVKIPLEAQREGIDLIFHTKFTVPLFTRAKTVMVLHGSAWYVDPQSYKPLDLFYIKRMMPIYHRKADRVVSVSNRAKEDMSLYAGADPGKFKTVYSAPDNRFFQEPNEAIMQMVKERYHLPDKFILNVGSVSTAKNIKNLLRAYGQLHEKVPHKLVIAGRLRYNNRDEFEPLQEYNIDEDVIFPGWVSQEDMPALYRLADLFLFPSWYESCSVALLEAMASGCAIVTSNTGGTPELTGDAAILVDPRNPEGIADAVYRVLTDEQLRQQLIRKSLKQGKQFSWDRCARETLAVLHSLNGDIAKN